MKKFLQYISIFVILVQLFAPFTVGMGVKNVVEVKTNKAEAAYNYSLGIKSTSGSDTITLDINLLENSAAGESTGVGDTISSVSNLQVWATVLLDGEIVKEKYDYFAQQRRSVQIKIKGLESGKLYETKLELKEKTNTTTTQGSAGSSGTDSFKVIETQTIDTPTTGEGEAPVTQTVNMSGTAGDTAQPINTKGFPACSILHPGTWGGCFGIILYWILFKPTSFIFGLAGTILDFTIMYSISDNSYRSQFVVEGWGVVRDFCNMFFIFVLLYIAFSTILNINGSKTKEMIIHVVIIGLLINFSLFATQVIIDFSNILARVFYNQQTIITGSTKDADGNVVSQLGDFGEIQLSQAIVTKVNPVLLITQANDVGKVNPNGDTNDEQSSGISASGYIIVVLLATAVNIVGMIAFLTSAFIFIGRVVGLWLAMILAPLAFFSYTVPALQDMKMVGWKKWWPDTLKMAFLAPVFVFFMYIIVGFMDKGLGLVNVLKAGSGGTFKGAFSFVIAIVVPFMFIMILLMKAKDIAKDLSGEIGAAMTKAGSAVGGMVLGAGVGLGATAMRGTIGRLGNKLATSRFASTNGAIGRGLGNLGKWAGSKSFDVRTTKLGAEAGKGLGVDLGKAKEGGYAKHYSDKVEKRQKRAQELEVHENEPLKQELNEAERDLQTLNARNSHQIEQLDKRIKGANDASLAAAALVRATDRTDPQFATRQAAAQAAAQEVIRLRTQRSNIKNGVGTAEDEHGNLVDQTHNTDNGLISRSAVDNAIAEATRTQREANEAEAASTAAAADIVNAQAAATAAANTAIANATPANLAASAAARAAVATAVTAAANAAAAAATARNIATNAGATAAAFMNEAHRTGYGRSMNDLEDHVIPDARHEVERENIRRRNSYAHAKARWGGRANREAEHKIIMGMKTDTSEKH